MTLPVIPANPQVSDAIALVQSKSNDTPTSHLENDDLTEYVDTVRTVFKLAKKNIVAGNGTCRYIKDGGSLTALDPTDPVFGVFTITPAPQTALELFYYFQDFTITEIQGFVDQALLEMGFSESNLSPDGIQSSNVPAPLFLAMGYFGAAYAGQVRMQRFAENFNATLEGTALEESEIYKAYRASYQDNIREGLRIREEFWGGQTRSKMPYMSLTSRSGYRENSMEPKR
jgi:hypothetical protein